MELDGLPPELIYLLATMLEIREISALVRTSKHFGILKSGLLAKGMTQSGNPIKWAASRGDLGLAARVLDEDTSTSCRSTANTTTLVKTAWIHHYEDAFLEAASKGQVDIIKLLLDRLPVLNPNSVTTLHEQTAIWLAGLYGHVKVIRVLIESGRADPNWTDLYGQTAMRMAVETHEPDAVRTLLQLGADPMVPDLDGTLPSSRAAYFGHTDILEIFADHDVSLVKSPQTDELRWAPVHYAVRGGRLDALKALAGWGADLTARDERGDTPLSLAVSDQNIDVIEFLLEQPGVADGVRVPNAGGTLMLIDAVRYNADAEVINKLIAVGGADPNTVDLASGMSALAIAVHNDSDQSIPALMMAGADPNQRDAATANLGDSDTLCRTPLAAAAARDDDGELIALFLDQSGCPVALDLNVADTDCSPLACAIRAGNCGAVHALINSGRVDLNMVYLIPEDQLADMPPEAAAVAEARVRGPALFIAIQKCHIEIVKILLAAQGIDLGACDHLGRSLVAAASDSGEQRLVDAVKEGCILGEGQSPIF